MATRKNRNAIKDNPLAFTGLDGKTYKLTLKQKLFAEAWVENRGNGVQAAQTAGYKGSYNVRRAVSIENLQKPTVLAYIRFLLKDMGLSHETADRELLSVMHQQTHLPAKVQAIREYNRLEKRGESASGNITVIINE